MCDVAVVVPAYNAARTIERAVRSLTSQTIRVNVIVVDDGSSDDTAELAARAGARVIRQQNSGAYMARVVGTRAADAPYVGYLDADDFARPDMYEKLLGFAEAHDLDIAQCDYTGKGGTPADAREELFLSRDELAKKVFPSRFVRSEDAVHIWDKLYRRELIQDFEPSNIMMFDDLAFNAQAFAHVERVGYLHEVLYDYDVNEGSSVRNFRLRNIADLKEAIRFRRKYSVHYGVRSDDVSHDKWIAKNVRNMYIVACSAPIRDGVPRMQKVKALLDLPEVVSAHEALDLGFRRKIMRQPLSVLAVGQLKRLRAILKGMQ